MSTPPIWTLHARGLTGPRDGPNGVKLDGCHITMDEKQTHYEFTKPNNEVLGHTEGTTLSQTFSKFHYKGVKDWTITLSTAEVGGSATGSWHTPHQKPETTDVPPQSGDYTAQTGGGPLAVDEAASSASA